jgi:hypothetical protein
MVPEKSNYLNKVLLYDSDLYNAMARIKFTCGIIQELFFALGNKFV